MVYNDKIDNDYDIISLKNEIYNLKLYNEYLSKTLNDIINYVDYISDKNNELFDKLTDNKILNITRLKKYKVL